MIISSAFCSKICVAGGHDDACRLRRLQTPVAETLPDFSRLYHSGLLLWLPQQRRHLAQPAAFGSVVFYVLKQCLILGMRIRAEAYVNLLSHRST